ncbi:hypothetical protein ABB37_07042 [Leptomonas pyrrhocoris]|uniref:Uncharacterized protein n=1 Tax=Leptomonas pyrrhocoris TaxID=157538 RepID=A0A0N0VE91_LEPPY|nr:hypothetical protein ABB37_07042 [Leptomonas pyrrhocoris]KPA77721.1 hypothetical protein ABB37_07042 [Leptomonas pyrrhocoris]|eukprot:XP_015656160.1 hypothetical protein ABB37_07042 [Leptomonas pyrrhocoris]
MPVDYSQKLEALRELYERVQQKEADIPESAYTAAGVKNKARIKDIEKELSATKKKVSLEQKKETDAEIEKEQAQLAEENGMSLEEFKQKVLAKERTVGEGTDLAMRHTAQKKERAQQRELKETRRLADRGDFDLEVDYV